MTVRKKSETEGFSGRYIESFGVTILENLLYIFSLGNFMRSITSYLDFTLMLQQSGIGKSLYEIHFGDELLGSIHIPRLWNSRAEAVSADGVWSFNRQGLLKPKITASTQNGNIVAAYQPRSFKRPGIMTIGEEETYSVKIGIFRNTLDIFSRFDNHVIHFQNHGIVRFRSEITFSRSVKHIQQFPLIFFFSCYILLLHRRDAKRRAATI